MKRSKSYIPKFYHSFSILASDDKLESWVRHQAHLSHSIRHLIRWYVKNYGTTDALCENLDEPLGAIHSPEATHKVCDMEKDETIVPCNPFGRIY